jgi:hypothetical protein
MGFKESPIIFMRVMELAMAGQARIEMKIYLDGTVVSLENLQKHISKLERVLRNPVIVNLTTELKKYQFLRHEARKLDYIAESGKIRINPEKIKAVMKYPRQTRARKIK